MSQPGNAEIEPQRARSLRGQGARCPAPRDPDSEHCSACDAKIKAYRRKSDKARRAKLKKERRCARCGKPSKGTRCDRCKAAHRRDEADRRGRDQDRRGLDQATPKRGHYKTEVFADGAARTRYVGQAHRGGPTRDEQDASLVKLAIDAKRLLVCVLVAFPAERPAIDALPRIQRTEAWELVASALTRSARLQLEVAGSLAATWRQICAGCGRAHEAEGE